MGYIRTMKNKKKNALPTQVELFAGQRSQVALSAIMRSGAGTHQDKRTKKAQKASWRREEW